MIDAISPGKSVYDVLPTTGLISSVTEAAFGAACTLAFGGLPAGAAIVVADVGCAVAVEIVANAINA